MGDEEPTDPFAGLPAAKPKIKDEFTEKDKKPKEEEKIVITPAVLPAKPEPESELPASKPKEKISDEFKEKDKKPKQEKKTVIIPAVLPKKAEPEDEVPASKPKEKIS